MPMRLPRRSAGIALCLALFALLVTGLVAQAIQPKNAGAPTQARHVSGAAAADVSRACGKARQRVTRAKKAVVGARRALASAKRAARRGGTRAAAPRARKRVGKAKKALAAAVRKRKTACARKSPPTSTPSPETNTPSPELVGPPLGAPLAPASPAPPEPEPEPDPPPPPGYREAVMGTPGLMAYWRLGEASGTVATDELGSSPGSYHGGVALGQPGALAGDTDTASGFDGSDDEMTASGTSLAIGAQGTLEGWFNSESGTLMRDSASSGGWSLAYGSTDGQLAYRVAGEPYETPLAIASVRDGWHHFALTKSGSSTAYYVDGALVHMGRGAPSTAAVMPWRVMRNYTDDEFARGAADDVAVYHTALSAEDVVAHYKIGLGEETWDPAPAAPGGISATAGDGSVTLDWNDNTEPDLDGYDVYRATGTSYTKVNPARLSASGFTDTGLANGTTYFYVVTATDSLGQQSAASNEASATPGAPDSLPAAGLKAIWGPMKMPDGSSAFPVYEELGVDVFQYQLQWDRVASSRPASPTDPADPAYRWPSAIDGAIAQAEARGMEVALLVKGTPWWAVAGASPDDDVRTKAPSNVQDYASFLAAASLRYPAVDRWMIWGETNRWAVWSSGPVAYANLLDAAYGALKPLPGDPDIVIGGMTFTFGDSPWTPAAWVNGMVRSNGQRPRLDEYGHNPFARRCPDLESTEWEHDWARDMSEVDTFSGEVRAAFGADVRLWLSEFTVSDSPNRAFPTPYVESREEQAAWLRKAFRIAGSADYVSGIGWFNLHDEAVTVANGLTTGLMTYEGELKPAFDAYKSAKLDGSQPREPCT